ncbi:MAG: hypothetical protein RLZZ99_341 [Actinomycetota bacterium]
MIELRGVDERAPEWDRLNQITARLAAKDPTLWGPAAAPEAEMRLDWVDLPESSRELLPELDALSAWSRELGHETFILCGMGGSSLAPEVIAATFGKKLIVLDATDPNQIADALQVDLKKSCIIIASKSGSTIETRSQRSLFERRITDEGLEISNHLVVVTDPGSPLDNSARQKGIRVINANPKVGGRFSALSAFGLTPAALLGVDVSVLLDDAEAAAARFTDADSAPVRMAALLASSRYSFPRLYDRGSKLPGIGDWIEQLVAESTGKDGRGVLPVITETPDPEAITFDGSGTISVIGELGAQFIFWEWVTALTCFLLEVDPFNQPNVAESKERTSEILGLWNRGELPDAKPSFVSSNLVIFAESPISSVNEALAYLAESSPGYLAIMAYLNRNSDVAIKELRSLLESKFAIPTTFGWAPRFLHSTGQFHKGGPLVGAFLQITGDSEIAIDIPEAGYGFERLVIAQALGDLAALRSRKLQTIRIHLTNRSAGIDELIEAARSL